MHKSTKLSLVIAASALALTGCPSDDTGGTGNDTSGTETATVTMTGTSPTSPTTTPTTTLDPDTGSTTMPTTDTDPDTSSSSSTGCVPGTFEFAEDAPDAYTQEDRLGFPVINTALVGFNGDKDAYNQDAHDSDHTAEIFDGLDFLHCGEADVPAACSDGNTGLTDDLEGLYALCVPPSLPNDTCAGQAGPFAVPDVLRLDLTTASPSNFPNGRNLPDNVMDPILAVVLLDLDNEPIDQFVDMVELSAAHDGLPLSSPANDGTFLADFPYLGDPF